MKKNILIVEDNKACMDALVGIVKECDSASVIYCADNSALAYKYAMEERIDLFLVDIMLDNSVQNDVSGIVFADRIRKLDRYQFVPLVFLTSLEDYRMSAFQNLHCYSYIEKPFDFKKVKEVIRDALKYPVKDERNNRYIYYRKDGILYSLDTEKIIYIETVRRTLFVYLEDDEIKIPYKSCSSMVQELNAEDFLQCSRNVILNRRFIDYVDETNRYIGMKNGKILEIGRTIKKKFLQELGYGK